MKNLNEKNKSSNTSKVAAGVTALAVLATGTFAWSDMKQHKTNTAMGGGRDHQVSLVDIFNPEDAKDWKVGNDLDKEVRVTNTGNESDGEVFVRLSLREFMEIGAGKEYEWSEERYMLNSEGNFLTGKTADDLKAAIEAETDGKMEAKDENIVEIEKSVIHDEPLFFYKTDEDSHNGIYGRHLELAEVFDDGVEMTPVIEGTKRAEKTDHNADVASESEYPIIKLQDELDDVSKSPIRDYVTPYDLDNVVHYSEYNEEMGAKWVVIEDYVYWSEALAPGESTANLVDGLKLDKNPEGVFFYELHVELEAFDKKEAVAKLSQLEAEFGEEKQAKKDTLSKILGIFDEGREKEGEEEDFD